MRKRETYFPYFTAASHFVLSGGLRWTCTNGIHLLERKEKKKGEGVVHLILLESFLYLVGGRQMVWSKLEWDIGCI